MELPEIVLTGGAGTAKAVWCNNTSLAILEYAELIRRWSDRSENYGRLLLYPKSTSDIKGFISRPSRNNE